MNIGAPLGMAKEMNVPAGIPTSDAVAIRITGPVIFITAGIAASGIALALHVTTAVSFTITLTITIPFPVAIVSVTPVAVLAVAPVAVFGVAAFTVARREAVVVVVVGVATATVPLVFVIPFYAIIK